MKKSNQKNHTHVAEILRRIKSNLYFTQSLSQYFAMDDMLEPVTSVITDGIRRGLDLGASLRGGTDASNAQVYGHLAADCDHDNRFVVRKNENQNHGSRHFGISNSRGCVLNSTIMGFVMIENVNINIVAQIVSRANTDIRNAKRKEINLL